MHATIRTFGRIVPVDFLYTNLELVNNTSETQTNNNAVWLFIPKMASKSTRTRVMLTHALTTTSQKSGT